jgi:hypothetical protein
MRVPFAPRLSAETTSAIAIFLAAVSLTPAMAFVVRLLAKLAWPMAPPQSFTELLPPVIVLAAPLATWIVRGSSSKALVTRCLLGGPLAGFVMALGFFGLLRLRSESGVVLSPFFVAGTGLGLSFGTLCIYPVLQLAAARRHRAHSDQDVQLVNTAAWLAMVAAPSAVCVYSAVELAAAAVIPFAALIVAALATLRWLLRRRWLTRIFEGQEPGWRLERVSADSSTGGVPVAELLRSAGDERAVVRTLSVAGRDSVSSERAVVARLLPDYPW